MNIATVLLDMCLFCHVNPYGHVARESRGLMGGSPFMVSHYAAKFSDHRDCGSGDTNIHTNMVNLPQKQHVTSLIVYVWTLTSVIFIFFKAYGMSCSYTENFKSKKHLFYKYFPVSAMRFFWE